ncbi:hypothetical protein F5Y17DRAFT_106632 [Xylariaceae sp. FL0594]|nr:hypothetical protein F5Y17DRAFT_106632 [Xylariaceae sp. FL0594]
MGAGLDELIDSLLTEIAFSGIRGCSVSNLLNAIDSFYKPQGEDNQNAALPIDPEIATSSVGVNAQQNGSHHDLAVASKVWRWLAARSDVSVGDDRQFNHMSLEDVLALPEEPDAIETGGNDETSGKPTSKTPKATPKASKPASKSKGAHRGEPKEVTVPTVRPRLHVSEERQWRAITGHGPDLKRVPLFEWRALVDIASSKKKGILQGDLVRLTGQDKRSLPTRTDALARKGYVIKLPIVLRGGKSSRLWLAQFSEYAKDDQESEGLDYETVDLSKAALTSDLQPVPFCDKWNRDHIDYLALAQAFVAVVKAWELIRYCDARSKLGVDERVRQMRALAKTCRWLTNIGALSFVGAKFAGSNRLFKDCVKYIRDPAPEEWADFRTTPKTRMAVPSGRIGKRGDASRAMHATQPAGPGTNTPTKKRKNTKVQESTTPYVNAIPPPWKPQKPVPNSAFEVIKRAGSQGTSNAAICRQTLGPNFKRLAAAMTGSISVPTNTQAPHLGHLTSIAQLGRIGKTMTYTFYAASEVPGGVGQAQPPLAIEAEPSIAGDGEEYGFSRPVPSQFCDNPLASLTEMTRVQEPQRGYTRKMKQKRSLSEEKEEGTENRTPKRLRLLSPLAEAEGEASDTEEGCGTAVSDVKTQAERPKEPERPPGVYRGLPNSLELGVKRKGRKPKSLVLIFRSDKLKDPSFLRKSEAAVEPGTALSPTNEIGQTASVSEGASNTDPDSSAVPKKTAPTAKNGWFLCEKCGNSWKNSNGLEYHLTKSRSACNPDYDPPPVALGRRRRRSTQPHVLDSDDRPPPRATLTPREQIESRFDAASTPRKRSKKATASEEAESGLATAYTSPQAARGSIVLKDLEIYDVAEHRRLVDQNLIYATGNPPASQDRPSTYHVDREQPKAQKADTSASGSPSNQVPRARKPLPNISSRIARGTEVMIPVDGMAPGSSHRSLASFARPTGPNATFGARRRERIIQIVEYLLSQNDGVFPGQRSLFMAVVSVWAQEFTDLAPPDRRICQNTINQMERDGLIKQMHFFFFDDQAKMQECVVIAKADSSTGPGIKSSDDPRVMAVKEKMKEMYPDAYVPDAFSLAPDEAKLFDELAAQGRAYNHARSLRLPRDLNVVQDIETLNYANSVVGDILVNRHGTKRPADEMQADDQLPWKKARVDAQPSDMPEKTRRYRRRPQRHELWDSGKLAVYIWSQRQKASAMWEQHRCCMQDFNTGAWSWSADNGNAPAESITSILSSAKTARDFDAAAAKGKYRKRTCIFAGFEGAGDQMEVDDDGPYSGYMSSFGRRASYADGDDLLSSDEDVSMVDYDESLRRPQHFDRIFIVSTPESFEADATLSDDEAEQPEGLDTRLDQSTEPEDTEAHVSFRGFVPAKILRNTIGVNWPWLPLPFFEMLEGKSFALVGPMPNARWFLRQNLPNEAQDILKTARGPNACAGWADPYYGGFLRKLDIIMRWERSFEGSQILTHGTIAPEYIFMCFSPEVVRSSMKPLKLEWLVSNQYTPEKMPDEIINASTDDEIFGLSNVVPRGRKPGRPKAVRRPRGYQRTRTESGYPDSFAPPSGAARETESTIPDGFIEYKTRDLTAIPRQPRGRFNKPAAHDEKLGSKREDELIAACVVFRTLLGGLDRNLDVGLLLKHFPGMSLSALKKFWPRVSRERKSYVQALTAKFQSEFLVAYENGEVPPIDYDDLGNYDWRKVILWTSKLETHEDIDLPESRDELHRKYQVEGVADEATDWRETWFAITSTYNRIEAIASESMSIPLPPTSREERARHERARTWVRSICCTPLKGVDVKEKLVPKLLELGGGDAAETNRILERAVVELNKEKVITRTKGKDLGGNFRIHGMFSKQLEKMASTPKLRQAFTFKAQLDEVFRATGEHVMPYAADDGAILAALNMQAHGRILMETMDMPHIPFGFEPGNYEGRTFPKSYYHFKIRLTPTASYVYNTDMALLKQAEELSPPTEGPGGKLPIWVDFFGNIESTRWVDYVSMVTFTLAVKGPTTPKMCATLLKPMVDVFEVELIVQWLDTLGLLLQAVDGCGCTADEWWWLVVGHIVCASDRRAGRV